MKGSGTSTSNPIKHLLRKHHINAKTAHRVELVNEEEGGNDSEDRLRPLGFKMLYNTLNFEEFRFHLIRWIIKRHIPFSVMEDRNFQLMLKALNEGIKDRVVKNGDSIYDWVEHEFIKLKSLIIDILK